MLGLAVFIPTLFVLWVCALLLVGLWYSTSRHSPWARVLLRRKLLRRLPAEAAPLLVVQPQPASSGIRSWFLANYVLQLVGLAAIGGCFVGLLAGRPEFFIGCAELYCCVGLLWSAGALAEYCRPALAAGRRSCTQVMLLSERGPAGAEQHFTLLDVSVLGQLPVNLAAAANVVAMRPLDSDSARPVQEQWPQAA